MIELFLSIFIFIMMPAFVYLFVFRQSSGRTYPDMCPTHFRFCSEGRTQYFCHFVFWFSLGIHRKYRFSYHASLIMSLKTPLHLKVPTFLDGSIKFSPVAGFLPFRWRFALTQKFPKLEMNTSSPGSSLDMINTMRVSSTSVDCFLGKLCCQ